MTVNVEFSGTAVGRSVTSTYSAHPARENSISILAMQGALTQPVSAQNASRSLMDIFAGAPRTEEGVDPWIVVSRPQRGATVPGIDGANGGATIGRAGLRRMSSQLSRTVDAVIDSPPRRGEHGEEEDVVGTLLERTLSRRGLSDSSIHTTFLSHGEEHGQRPAAVQEEPTSRHDRDSVLQALSRKMQSFRFAGSVPNTASNADAGSSISRPSTPSSPSVTAGAGDGRQTPTGVRPVPSQARAVSPASRLFSPVNLSSWAAAALDPKQEFLSASPREDAFMHRAWTRETEM
ncbi:uncharacterized protein FIBRA_04407 [Fibroporia radiculosa]|uniref:Uncharacterized protein n=1 Tax=Fibroporia radiculosa TaxID=599839 RepID=J4IA54_9APHY|nr:uncharacterized protein FIBRA_04407 [Fibroporia radiculosa]CCM02316.1 predicted protein [Fibroporia radiculosa]